MAHLPDERFKHTINDLEDCLDAITDDEVEKSSEKQKAIRLFGMFLEFCMDMGIISFYNLDPLRNRLQVEDTVCKNNVYREQRGQAVIEVEYAEKDESEEDT